jgi:hypothetical protein
MCKEDPYRVLKVYAELEDMSREGDSPSPGLGEEDKAAQVSRDPTAAHNQITQQTTRGRSALYMTSYQQPFWL